MRTRRQTGLVTRHFGFSTAVALGAVGLLLGGCSSGGSPSDLAGGGATTTAMAPSTVPTTIPFSMAKNARQDVTTTGPCSLKDGEWDLQGTVTNSAKTARRYQIVVDFVTQPGNTVLYTKILNTALVRPKASLAWSARSIPGLAQVACVIRQVQAPA